MRQETVDQTVQTLAQAAAALEDAAKHIRNAMAALRIANPKRDYPEERAALDDALLACANYYGVPLQGLTTSGRARGLTMRARLVCYAVSLELGYSSNEVARRMQRLDHTTVLQGAASIRRRAAQDPHVERDLQQVRIALGILADGPDPPRGGSRAGSGEHRIGLGRE